MHNFSPEDCVSIGDSEMDLSMVVDGSRFIGFNPSRESSLSAFENAGVPIINEKDLMSYPKKHRGRRKQGSKKRRAKRKNKKK